MVSPDDATAAVSVQWVELVGRDGRVVRLDSHNFSIRGVTGSADNGVALASVGVLGPLVPVFCDSAGEPLESYPDPAESDLVPLYRTDEFAIDEARINASEIQQEGVVPLGP